MWILATERGPAEDRQLRAGCGQSPVGAARRLRRLRHGKDRSTGSHCAEACLCTRQQNQSARLHSYQRVRRRQMFHPTQLTQRRENAVIEAVVSVRCMSCIDVKNGYSNDFCCFRGLIS